MPDCHKCRLDGQHDAKFISCAGPSENPHNDGRVMVSLDEARCMRLAELCSEQDEWGDVLEFLRIWLRLPESSQRAIGLRLCNPELSDAEIGRLIGLTRAGVGKAVRQSVDVRGGRVVIEKELTLL